MPDRATSDWVTLLRPRQWSKNLLLYAAFLFTAGGAWSPDDLGDAFALFARATLALLAFSALSSAGYVLNDARDVERDRAHPRKRERPLAAGRIDARTATIAAAVCVAAGLLLAAPLGPGFVVVATAYLGGAALYSLALKHLAVLDISAVAALFALRVLAGAVAIEVAASPWILVCTFTGALYVAAVKREQERRLLGAGSSAHRAGLGARSRWPALTAAGSGVATVGLYAAYAWTAENVPADGSMLLTAPLVALAVGRYWQVAMRRLERDADEIAFRDPVVLALVVGFLALAVSILLAR
jgi:decaprenyl-phosphate phosphoribosyltransferase